jgi:hypothetical protein
MQTPNITITFTFQLIKYAISLNKSSVAHNEKSFLNSFKALITKIQPPIHIVCIFPNIKQYLFVTLNDLRSTVFLYILV